MSTLTLRWRTLLALVLLAILFVPVNRFRLPGGLRFDLETYQLVLAAVVGLWMAALLVDPQVRLRRTGFEWPLAVIAFAFLASLLANPERLNAYGTAVARKLVLFATLLLVLVLIASVIRERAEIDALCKLLVAGGAVLAVLAIVESQTGENVFDRLSALPFLRFSGESELFLRGGRVRAYASAQHPIALGAALVVLLPLSVYLARRSRATWWLASAALMAGAVATISRTAVVMLGVALAVLVWLRPRETWRLVPAAALTFGLVQLLLPGSIETLREVFFPAGGLTVEQSANARLSDFAPASEEFAQRPLLGQGFGTRIVPGPESNAILLDNQWLFTLLETGLLGVAGLAWLLVGFVLRSARAARADTSDRGWLASALAASIAAFATGMATYDAFAFEQVTLLAVVLLGFGAVLLRPEREVSPAGYRPRAALARDGEAGRHVSGAGG